MTRKRLGEGRRVRTGAPEGAEGTPPGLQKRGSGGGTVETSSAAPRARTRDRLPLAAVIGVGLALALYRFGLPVLAPGNVRWFRGDSAWHFMGWHFFRQEPWQFPPGRIAGLLAPPGTSIGSTDALPLLAFPFKLAASALPDDFQYLGLWLFASYMLQGLFGYLLVGVFCRSRLLKLLGGLFFLFSPIMLFRAGHIALSGHWLILFALWHYAATAHRSALHLRSYAGLWLLIIGLAGLTHPYLAAMVFPVALASLIREWRFTRRLRWRAALGLTLGVAGMLAFVWWLQGLLGAGQQLESWGFSKFSMNLNAPVNPLSRSRWLPPLPVNEGQYEGFAYLGLGVISLSVLALVFGLVRWRGALLRAAFWRLWRGGHRPLLLFCVGLTMLALSDVVALGERVVLQLPFGWLGSLTSTFRAPGRLFWLPYYVFYLFVLVGLLRRLPRTPAALVLAAGLLLQVGDLNLNRPFSEGQVNFSAHLTEERWAQLIGPFETIAQIPPFQRSLAYRGDHLEFGYLAANHGKRLTTGAAARLPAGVPVVKNRLRQEVLHGPRNADRLYVFNAVTFAERYLPRLQEGLRCFEIDAYVACHNRADGPEVGPEIDLASYVPPGYERLSLVEYTRRYEEDTVIVVAKGEMGEGVSAQTEDFFASKGSDLADVSERTAYAAIFHQGRLVFEAVSQSDPVEARWVRGDTLRSLTLPTDLVLYSAGPDSDAASVIVGGRSVVPKERGLNVVALGRDFEVLSHASFDTRVSDLDLLQAVPRSKAGSNDAAP